jgi:glycosyltransferase involved in cell wall biosynthesis
MAEMKILYDHQVFSLQDAGGISRYFYELASFMGRQAGMRTRVAMGMSGSVLPFAELKDAGVAVEMWRGGGAPGKYRYLGNEILGSALALAQGKVDIYHPTLYRRMPLVRARGVVATQHDCIQERFPHLFQGVEKKIRANRNLLAQADAIICVSESTRQDLLATYPVDAAKIRVIHHGLNQLPRSAVAAAELNALMRREYLLYVGSRAAYKNFDGLLQAYRDTGLYKSLDLLVIGGGTRTHEENGLAARLEIADCLRWLPHCSDGLLGEAYAGARLFVYPSLYEGFGFPPLEAMSLDCPTLVCHTSSLPEVCRDAPFYFVSGDQASFAATLLEAVKDEEKRALAVVRGRDVAHAYSWEKCGQETLELYRACLHEF